MRVEFVYSDSSKKVLTGKNLRLWNDAQKAAFMSDYIHRGAAQKIIKRVKYK